MRIADLAKRRVAVWGFGREGRAALAALQARLPDSTFKVFCNDAEAEGVREILACVDGHAISVSQPL